MSAVEPTYPTLALAALHSGQTACDEFSALLSRADAAEAALQNIANGIPNPAKYAALSLVVPKEPLGLPSDSAQNEAIRATDSGSKA